MALLLLADWATMEKGRALCAARIEKAFIE